MRDSNKERRRDVQEEETKRKLCRRKKKKNQKEERDKWAMCYMLSPNVKWAVLCVVKTKQLS